MKESVGALSLTTIVIFFIILFSGYLCISVNNTKAYNVKNEMINIIQKHNGLDDGTFEEIRDYMSTVGYRSTGPCDPEFDGVGYSATGTASGSRGALFCIKEVQADGGDRYDPHNQFPDVKYYKIKVFFSLDLPIFNNAFSFSLSGVTKNIFYPVELGD